MIKLNDNIKVVSSDGVHFRTKYRCFCDNCGADRGYQTKQNATVNLICRKCKPKHTEESKLKMSMAKRGKPSANKGKTASLEARVKMSTAKLGKLAKNKGVKATLEQRIKLSCLNRGIDVSEFDDFTTEINKAERNKLTDSGLHLECFQKSDFTCDKCNIRGGTLNAHHLNSWKHFPEQRFDIANLVTLCNKCHKSFHKQFGNGKKMPNTLAQYIEFKNNQQK